MIADKTSLLAIIDRIETGIIIDLDIVVLRGAIQRLDEMDDLVDAVCSCRTQEVPVLRPQWPGQWDDVQPGNRP